jgi:hypothetical protein
MALAVNRSGTIFKKCDQANHRPGSNGGCAALMCQHTCGNPERCPHAWTLRYLVNGKQVEKSFRDKKHPTTGRVDYGSGKKAGPGLAAQAHRGQALGGHHLRRPRQDRHAELRRGVRAVHRADAGERQHASSVQAGVPDPRAFGVWGLSADVGSRLAALCSQADEVADCEPVRSDGVDGTADYS